MDIHEYQAKVILKAFNVPAPEGFLVVEESTDDYIENNLKTLGNTFGNTVFAVKAQIHAGGRGKAGGVKITKSLQEAKVEANKMLGKVLVTHQTGPSGQKVRKVYIEPGQSIKKEYYLSLVIDRETSKIVIIGSSEGGMEIEEVAKKTPEKIVKVYVDATIGISDFHARKLGFSLDMNNEQVKKFVTIVKNLYRAFIAKDASQIEINPLIENSNGDFIALDAKINFDDNALFKQKDILALRDTDEEEALEIEASKYNLNYIKMDGEIGCMVNGAGLAMATMDIIKYYGSSPANFLDVGGGATLEQVYNAFKIISADEKVKGILVNIFGGIMRCDIIAEGIVTAAREIGIKFPLVVRLVGTNYEQGRDIIERSGLNITMAEELGEAAQKIVELTKVTKQ